MAVDGAHAGDDIRLVVIVILEDAQRVDPEISEAEVLCHLDRVPESLA